MEYLSFSPLGQWTLHKALQEPKDAGVANNTPFKSYTTATAEGRLPQDHGQKGALHAAPGAGRRLKPQGVKGKDTWGKPPHKVDSVYEDVNPGAGVSQ